jgi:hypothetical protein
MAEAMVAVSLVTVAFTSTLAALTRMNTFASVSRNYTGAYVAAEKRIDWILSAGPFNPQKGQIPVDVVNNCDGTTTTVKLDPNSSSPSGNPPGTYTEPCAPIYNDPPTTMVGGVLQFLGLAANAAPTFTGTTTTVVTDVSPTPSAPPYIYRATVTVIYTYRNRNYSFSMSTLRTSDT